MDLYQRLWGEKFTLTEEEKKDIMANIPVFWQGEPVKHAGTSRFHILYHVGDMDKPIYENQWLIKKDGGVEILWDEQAKGKYLFAAPQLAPETAQPFQSEALRKYLESKQNPVENPLSEVKQPEPSKVKDEFGKEQMEEFSGAPIYDAQKNDEPAPAITGQVEQPAPTKTTEDPE